MAKVQLRSLRGKHFPYGYIVSQAARERLQLDALSGVLPAGVSMAADRVWAARAFAERINSRRDFSRPGTVPARAGELLSIGLLTDVLRYVAQTYCEEINPGAMGAALAWARDRAAPDTVEKPIPAFVRLYPPPALRPSSASVRRFLAGKTGKRSNRECVATELVLLDISMSNPAMASYQELYEDAALQREAPTPPLLHALDAYFANQPPFPDTGQPLLAMLRAPMLADPYSIEGQLAYIRKHWKALLPLELLEQLELAEGILREETAWRGLGPGPTTVLKFGHLADLGYEEFEAFSVDRDWMPNLVLIAKTVYVWLDQLSKKHQRAITRLDEIPDEELDLLAHWGFTGLWLIGVWERSPASRSIKQRMGNPEAVSSAYSLYDYAIAADLGGDAAYENLARRAARRGIRLASDMVPNHVGIYSRWVVEHPEWFIQLEHPPFPSYRFTGPNLSHDDRVGIYIEDGYWNHSDAAVVFKRVDHGSGHVRYIYHGNDGTSMPWNDTAQLNFTLPEVREAVMQTILHVARKFPVIRFDAAMTLAKRHYQRLWFPKPGDAGAIPSRAEHGMSKAEFDRIFPTEFWRDVVDRVAVEAPDTLLLAEAFWLMEGYFVRTLGMHRVYNSAFMNMLKMEDNAKYRQTVKNVLEFSPEVLQRFVNFMNNPDEDTAEAQFGRGDKYIGVAVLLVTMPGLPMFGHGQIEGFREKYGMEYRCAYWDEEVDQHLVRRHESEVFPLMRRRRLFSGARYFAFFDFVVPEGWVDENVFAYANRTDGERALVLYNNAYQTTRGVIHTSTAINEGSVDEPRLCRRTLSQALALNTEDNCYYIFRDHRTNSEYLRHAQRIASDGLHVELQGYQYCAFVDWREVHDVDHSWGRLHATLAGQGVSSVEEAYLEMHLSPVLDPFRRLMTKEMLELLAKPGRKTAAFEVFRPTMGEFLSAIAHRMKRPHKSVPVITAIEKEVVLLQNFRNRVAKAGYHDEALAYLYDGLPEGDGFPIAFWRVPLVWCVVRRIGAMATPAPPAQGFDVTATSAAWLREWFLTRQIARVFRELEDDAWRAEMDARLVRICVAHGGHLLALQTEPWGPVLDLIFKDADVRTFLRVNQFAGRVWLNKEQFDRMLYMLFLTLTAAHLPGGAETADTLMLCLEDIQVLREAAEDAGYDLYRMIDSLK